MKTSNKVVALMEKAMRFELRTSVGSNFDNFFDMLDAFIADLIH